MRPRTAAGLVAALLPVALHFLTVLFLPAAVGAAPAYDLETSVARMARIGSAFSPSFSPDGSRLAFLSHLGGLPPVWTVAAFGGWPGPAPAPADPVGVAGGAAARS